MRILLTGASGFVGDSILRRLATARSLSVSTISRSQNSKMNIDTINQHHAIDISSPHISTLMKKEKYDLLIHAAWEGLPNRQASISYKNLDASTRLFEEFLEAGGKFIIGFGSCLEYGNLKGKIRESAAGENLTDFAIAKRTLLHRLTEFKIPHVWLRPFYLYGPNQHEESLLKLCIKHRGRREFTWIKDPSASNDFVSITDLSLLIEEIVTRELWIGELNCGTSRLLSNISFTNIVRRYLGENEFVFSQSARAGMAADLTKLHKFLPDFQFTSPARGVRECIEAVLKVKA